MNKPSLADRLDRILDELLAQPAARAETRDRRLAPLLRLAEDLRGMPEPGFKEHLRTQLERKINMQATTVTPIPAGYRTVTPYIVVQHAAEMIDFLKQTFGAQEKFRTIGSAGGIHAEVQVGDSMMMIGGGGAWRGTPMPTALHYYVPDADAVCQRAVATGATSLLEMREEYGERFGALKDPFGNDWYIATYLGSRYVPEGLSDVNVCLHPVGAARLIEFTKRAFAAEEVARYDSPEGQVLHARIRVGDSIIEMGEAHGPWQNMPTMLYLYVPDVDAVYARALAAGARSISPLKDQPYGDRSGGVQDEFGNQWYIATHISDQPL